VLSTDHLTRERRRAGTRSFDPAGEGICAIQQNAGYGAVAASTLGSRMTFVACGIVGADAEPNWQVQPPRGTSSRAFFNAKDESGWRR
jgi:hypothetical protein